MKFFQFYRPLLTIAAAAQFIALASCKTTNSGLQSSASNQIQADAPAPEAAWVLVPNIQNIVSPAVLDQTTDASNPAAPVQVCLYFNRGVEPKPSSKDAVEPNVFQFWLQPGEYCSEKEKPGEAGNLNQFLGAKTLAIKTVSDVAWVLYLGDRAIGDALVDTGTGLPLIQSLCSGKTYEKACRIVATPRSIKIVPAS
ncbi:MAG: hypothetical protein EOP07_20075 [Proteobacteria bacterium]|nr:MAG: hypothetical protein EOP07_20075 [Pseudomonadota bacterium]